MSQAKITVLPPQTRTWTWSSVLISLYFNSFLVVYSFPSVLWHCWLGVRKSIRPLKTEWWGAGVVICLQWGANDLHMVQLIPLKPHHLLLQ